MKHIGLLSDTHGSIPTGADEFFQNCDEIWHAGDFGSTEVPRLLEAMKPLRGVYGNIDGSSIRLRFPEYLVFDVDKLRVVMMHIGGYPGRYEKKARELIAEEKPGLFVSGHSHILKVMYDKKHKLLHINPGAAGKYGFHKTINMLRFVVDGSEIKDLEVFELDREKTLAKQ